MNKVVLIDGNSLVNRAYYAITPLSNTEGIPTNAVYGFCNMLIRIITDVKPKYLCVCFDVKAPTFRHSMYSEYKAGRRPMPEDLVEQFPLLKEVLKKMNVHILEQAGLEADDILGVLSKRFSTAPTIIVTGDRDALQLVDESTEVWLTKKGLSDILVVTPQNIEAEFGVSPSGVIDLKALMGDASDNIPGVAGVGEVTAKKLLSEYKTLDGVYANLDKISGKLLDKLQNGKESAYLSHKLATINTNADIACDMDELTYVFPFSEDVFNCFKRLNFLSIVRRENLFTFSESEKTTIGKSIIVTEMKDLPALEGKKIALTFCNENIQLSFDAKIQYEIVISKTLLGGGVHYLDAIAYIFKTAKHVIVYDYKTLKKFLIKNSISSNVTYDDFALFAYIQGHSCGESVTQLLEQLGYSGKTTACEMFKAFNEMREQASTSEVNMLYDTELEVSNILLEMENSGVRVNIPILKNLQKKYRDKLTELKKTIFSLCGEEFNLNSPAQLGGILFEKLGLQGEKKNRKGFSTSSDVLENLYDRHEVISHIMLYRQFSKLLSTYIDGIERVLGEDGFAHTEYKQFLTMTGRLSSIEPNLQNLPQTELGREVREMFEASTPQGMLVSADYSQVELRLLAHLSGDERLIEAFIRDIDVHTLTASHIFNVKMEDVSPVQRRQAKTINFGIIYGKGEFSLSKELGISRAEAKIFIDEYFETYPKVRQYLNDVVSYTRKHAAVKTMFGRIRMMPEIKSANFQLRAHAERAATNLPLQGSAADVMKFAMIRVHRRLVNEKLVSRLVLQVHDELIIDAVEGEVEIVKKILKEEMEQVASLRVPLTVEVSANKNWLEE